MIVGTDVHNLPVPEVDANRMRLLQASSEETEGDRRSIVSYEKRKINQESSDDSDDAGDSVHKLTHKLR